jgi:hypothetical protein
MKTLFVIAVAAALAVPGLASAQRALTPTGSWASSAAHHDAQILWQQRLGESLDVQAPVWKAAPLRLSRSVPMRLAWTRTDVVLASGFTAALLIDAGQTRGLAQGG